MKARAFSVAWLLTTLCFSPFAATATGCQEAQEKSKPDTPSTGHEHLPNDGSLEFVTLLRHRDGLLGWVNSIDWSDDGKYIASGGSGGTIRLWDVATWEMIRELRQPEEHVRTVAFSPRNNVLLSAGDVESGNTSIHVWDVESGALRGSFRQHSSDVILCAAVSPDGTTAASGGHDNTIRIWPVDLKDDGVQFKGHHSSVNSVAYSSDGSRIVSSSDDASVRMWDASSGTELWRRDVVGRAASAAISPDDQLVAFGDVDVRLLDADNGSQLHVWEDHEVGINWLAFSPTHRLLISSDTFGNTLIRSVSDGKEFARITRFPARDIAISPDGKLFALAASDGTIRIWRMPLDAEGVTTWDAPADEPAVDPRGAADN